MEYVCAALEESVPLYAQTDHCPASESPGLSPSPCSVPSSALFANERAVS
ncbi:MAG: hypothetical protein IPH77_11990 [Ignavibacteria bacterium]|nr:hypothetical protein [Ignavibacteria bacterium]